MFSIPAAGYCIDYQAGRKLVLTVGSTNRNNYILGSCFMRNFYTELNHESSKMNFAISKYASAGTFIGVVSVKTYFGIQWYWWVIVALASLVIITWTFLIIKCCFKRFCKKKQVDVDSSFESQTAELSAEYRQTSKN